MKQNWRFWLLGMSLALLVGGSIWFLSSASLRSKAEIEVLPVKESAEITTSTEILVDVSGAVINPGVYELVANSRVKDALIAAGGLQANANHQYISKNINMAQKVSDGQKLYFPFESGDESSKNSNPQFLDVQKINLNTASLSQLDQLWGIGPARAQAIIDSRPYNSLEDLITKKIIPTNVFEKIKTEINL